MLLIGIVLMAAIAGICLLNRENRGKVLNDFCKAECKQNIEKKYKFCC